MTDWILMKLVEVINPRALQPAVKLQPHYQNGTDHIAQEMMYGIVA